MINKVEPYSGIAAIYDEIRPSYPEELIGDIISRTNLKVSDNLLEIGAGTGKATVQLAEKGFRIHAIELGEHMAEIFKYKCAGYPKVTLDVVPFEAWNNPLNEQYDMIYSAQAFHWLDSNVKYKKCHELLKDDGHLVLFWYNPCDNEQPEMQEIEEKVNCVVKKYVAEYYSDKGKSHRREHDGVSKEDERKAEIEASGLFELIKKIDYTHETRNDAKQYLKVRRSVPAFTSILDGLESRIIEKMEDEIEEIINSHGGYVGAVFKFSLYICKKK